MSAKSRENTFPTTPPPPLIHQKLGFAASDQHRFRIQESKGIRLGEELGSPTLSATLNSGILLSSERSGDVLRSTKIV